MNKEKIWDKTLEIWDKFWTDHNKTVYNLDLFEKIIGRNPVERIQAQVKIMDSKEGEEFVELFVLYRGTYIRKGNERQVYYQERYLNNNGISQASYSRYQRFVDVIQSHHEAEFRCLLSAKHRLKNFGRKFGVEVNLYDDKGNEIDFENLDSIARQENLLPLSLNSTFGKYISVLDLP